LNPPSEPAGGTDSADGKAVSIMGFGREIFGNIEEIAVFVMPAADGGRSGPPVPEIGLVIAVKDADQSEALWSQLLALSALIGAPSASAVGEISIHGQPAKVYTFPDCPPIVLAKLNDRALVAGTEAAVRDAVAVGESEQGICDDATFQPLLERLGATASKAVLVDVGRVIRTAASCQPGNRQAQELMLVGALLKDLRLFAVSEEGPTRLSVRIEATGLPNVPSIIKEVAK
jgi:hypothetical protein